MPNDDRQTEASCMGYMCNLACHDDRFLSVHGIPDHLLCLQTARGRDHVRLLQVHGGVGDRLRSTVLGFGHSDGVCVQADVQRIEASLGWTFLSASSHKKSQGIILSDASQLRLQAANVFWRWQLP
jgi:hypothetical protein